MRRRARQQTFAFLRWGGKRKGAGRKPKGERAGVSHGTRTRLAARFPVHVTVRLNKGLPSLRRKNAYRVLTRAFAAGGDRFGFRLIHFSIQSNHLHLLAEAEDRRALARGMQGLSIRIARGLNRLWRRTGKVFADRYHDHILRTPTEVRNAIRYVLHNVQRHGIRFVGSLDPFTSAGGRTIRLPLPRSWLLTRGWRRARAPA